MRSLGIGHVDRADPGVQVAVPVTVALIDPVREGRPHPAPQTASASAESSASITVPSR